MIKNLNLQFYLNNKNKSLMFINLGLDKYFIFMVIYEFFFILGFVLYCEYFMKKNKILVI